MNPLRNPSTERPADCWTAREIRQQPAVWRAIGARLAADGALAAFLAPRLADPTLRIVLTGAGSSAYVGRCLAPALTRMRRVPALAIATTDLVADPAGTLGTDATTLVVHFARSGNSPESVAALELAEQALPRCAHLVITCNADGALAAHAGRVREGHVLLLPDECNDRSFAMTSSFTGMLLAAALALGALPADAPALESLARAGEAVLEGTRPLVAELVAQGFRRVVYLGGRELAGLAEEAALKLLELTDGRIVSLAETPLGFRHGPKTIVDAHTLVVVLVGSDAYGARYDEDLLAELRRDRVAGRVLALRPPAGAPAEADTVRAGPGAAGDLAQALTYLAFGQAFALASSLAFGLDPDSPNAAGTVNRVVKGVTIHPFAPRP